MVTIPGRRTAEEGEEAVEAVELRQPPNQSRKRLYIQLGAFVMLLLICSGLISKAVTVYLAILRETSRTEHCQANLQRIGKALAAYQDEYGTLPPAYVADADGRPQHSWRVLILPYLDEKDLYKRYDLSQPWDSEANHALASQMPPVYACPARSDEHLYHTNYLALVGPGSAFPGVKGVSTDKITDGTTFTIIVAESTRTVDWLSPTDLVIPAVKAEAAAKPAGEEQSDVEPAATTEESWGLGSEHLTGVNVLFADGHATNLTEAEATPEKLRPLVTIDAGD